ncbi:hypothetical protein ACIBBB_26470 [Streptomyces sp. NPDC051217]|uniref:hypothetical protein n=1 Tax=Streptomyces sp. NPDC051217 TaxID=3365644 RepID=UPI00379800F2
MKRLRNRGRVALVAVAATCAVVAQPGLPGGPGLPGLPGLVGTARAAEGPSPYAFDPGAERVQGAASTSAARQLEAGSTYRGSIEPGKKLFYRLDLDDAKNAYVSATAVPELGSSVDYGDKLTVTMQDSDGRDCDSEQARVLSASDYPHPLTAYATRTLDGKEYGSCRKAGPYYVIVERESKPTSTQDAWDLELRFLSEPGVVTAGPTEAPEDWPSASPEPPSGAAKAREGGAGFSDAASLGQGEWTAEIDPGESLFYRVPVNWGQQLFTSAELGSSEGDGFVTGALSLAVYNPARGLVDGTESLSYRGEQKSLSTEPAPPVDYANRFSAAGEEKAMRFAGWYYVRVSLNPEVGEKFGQGPHDLTLRVTVDGTATDGPGYDGPAGEFSVPDEGLEGPDGGKTASAAEDTGTMKLVAAGGIGTGTVLVLGLGGWMLLARRRGTGR